MDDLEILARGLYALRELEKHDNGYLTAGIDACRPCGKFAGALLRRADTPENLLHLRCPAAQAWHAEVRAAFALADQVLDR